MKKELNLDDLDNVSGGSQKTMDGKVPYFGRIPTEFISVKEYPLMK